MVKGINKLVHNSTVYFNVLSQYTSSVKLTRLMHNLLKEKLPYIPPPDKCYQQNFNTAHNLKCLTSNDSILISRPFFLSVKIQEIINLENGSIFNKSSYCNFLSVIRAQHATDDMPKWTVLRHI